MKLRKMKKTAENLMTSEPACILPHTTLREAGQRMRDHDCGELPVVDNEKNLKLIGVITDRDMVCRGTANGLDPNQTPVSQCMTSPCISVHPETSLDECFRLMEEEQIRRLPVVDSEGKCCGILSQADIAVKLSEDITGEVVKNISKGHKE